ncbi:hypothetical protein [Sphingopyxis sp. GW247-27LB]|uniref:hypothetical protein n=1 Tax=Sphingopyxis sp. GW247-27LB TaxID=2012632 RepID=UPI000BA5A3B9|nr:hypothetical protein [Sphingopyxis sp. GW247-27LB]PAL24536.1 hypothetical protein CD928_03820 [Sphingopyxis sp. GW247-27LB]
MRQAARIIGIAWMVACVGLWIWAGFFLDWSPLASYPSLANWSVVTLLQDSKFGLTMLPIILAVPGYALYRWGAGEQAKPQ